MAHYKNTSIHDKWIKQFIWLIHLIYRLIVSPIFSKWQNTRLTLKVIFKSKFLNCHFSNFQIRYCMSVDDQDGTHQCDQIWRFLPLWVIFEVYVAFGKTLNLIRPKFLLLANFRCWKWRNIEQKIIFLSGHTGGHSKFFS